MNKSKKQSCPQMEEIGKKFDVFTQNPVKFLGVQTDVKQDLTKLVKSLYDFTKSQEKGIKKVNNNALPQLVIQELDEEQIWQQIELQNNECWDNLVWEVANCMSLKDDLTFPVQLGSEEVESGQEEIKPKKPSKKASKTKPAEIEENVKSAKKTSKKVELNAKPKQKTSIVDDNFFKLQEMEQFLLREERNEGKNVPADSDEESIDMFDEIDDDDDEEAEGERDAMYTDFFEGEDDGINGHDSKDMSSDDGSTNDDDDEGLNGDDLDDGGEDLDEVERKKIQHDHFDNNDEGPEGEDDQSGDDQDLSLDEEDEMESPVKKDKKQKSDKKVRFEQPFSSSEDEASDTNEPKTDEKKSEFELRQERLKQTIDRLEKKNLNEAPWQLKGEVDATKRPQNSLLEEVVDFDLTSRPAPIITEQTTITLEDIIRQRIKDKAWDDVEKKEKPVDDQLSFRKTEILDHAKSKMSLAQVYEAEYLKQKQAVSGEEVEEKEPEAHTEIKTSMSDLFAKLDALCHYHYTPKAVQADVKIVANTPAISMEEVAPVATSDATLLAPEEVKKKKKGDLMTKEERTQTDKNRERRKKKKFQREKLTPKVIEHRNTKKGTEVNSDKSLKTSKAFFQQLNDDATSILKNNKNKNVKNKGK